MIKTDELKHSFGIEMSAIILLCRIFVGTAKEEEFESFILGNDINWDLVYNLTRLHQIRPVVYKVLHKFAAPAEIKNKLQADCRQIALHNFEHTGEIIKLHELLSEANITALPYKGSIFGLEFYKDIGLREFSDIDFLVDINVKDLEVIKTIFERRGYIDKSDVPEDFKETHLKYTREYNFDLYVNDQRKYHVEFHWLTASGILDFPTPLPMSVLFRNLGEHDINGKKIKTLNHSNHLLAVVTHHGLNQRWSILKYIIDLSMAVKNGVALDPALIVNTSKTYGFNNALNIGLYISDQIIGINNTAIYTPPADGHYYLNELLNSPDKKRKKTSEVLLLNLRIKDHFPAQLKMILKYIRSAGSPSLLDYQFLRLPKSLYFLYAFIKPIRIITNSIKENNR